MQCRSYFRAFVSHSVCGWHSGLLGAIGDNLCSPPTGHSRRSSTPADSSTQSRCTVRKDAERLVARRSDGEAVLFARRLHVQPGLGKQSTNPAKPSYAALRHYDTPDAWADASLRRLKVVGLHHGRRMERLRRRSPASERARSGGSRRCCTWVRRAALPWFDMWDEKVIRRIEEVAQQNIGPLARRSRASSAITATTSSAGGTRSCGR